MHRIKVLQRVLGFLLCSFITLSVDCLEAQSPVSGTSITPVFESTNLWNAGVGGYLTYRIPGIVTTKRGTILAYTSARKGPGDWSDIDVVVRRSTDGGHTWDASRVLVGEGHGVTDNPVAISDAQTGAIHFLFQRDYEHCFYMRSDDDGLTFTKPVDITSVFEQFRPEYDWHVIAPGVGHAIQLSSGRLLVPLWMSLGAPSGPHSRQHRPSAVSTIYSDDHGQSWKRGAIIVNTTKDYPNPSESMAVQLSNGGVMISIRNESKRHRRLVSISPDGISHWTKPEFSDQLFEPVCAASIIAVKRPSSAANSLLLFSNPDSEDIKVKGRNKFHALARQNLTVRSSDNDGASWQTKKVVDPGVAGYSDLSQGADGMIYLIYEGGSVDGSETTNDHVFFTRFNFTWLFGSTLK
jgi:sialidase-1